MAIVVRNTNYSGEVLENILAVATTGNELVSKGLIMVIPGVEKEISVPRLRAGKMLQKRKEDPQKADAKGEFEYSEKKLDPEDFMAFTVFNPRTFEDIWRPFQPKGNLVFSELPPEVQNKLLETMSKQVQFELGWHYINGVYAKEGDDNLMNGILTQAAKDEDCIIVKCASKSMIDRLYAVLDSIPEAMLEHPNLRILMSKKDFLKYDKELTEREHKNSDETRINEKTFKGIKIETVSSWPSDVLLATLCSPDADGNLFAAVNLQDDESVIQIDKLSNASELYFLKLLMKADTNIGFGEEIVVFDGRENPVFKPVPAIPDEGQETGKTPEEGV
ncbi:hypothetical protein [Duncaniella muris]|uniref:hypothetical protein n=1 Tax=Duncaniella muris TaxID=2094150 RepID=UPI0027147913|nr:hypothetical protein [Duncaniella muris]